jgi:putative intracellular protease/amidase/YHS domain-containing protein
MKSKNVFGVTKSRKEGTDTMKRRDLLKRSAAFGFMAAVPFSALGKLSAVSGPLAALGLPDEKSSSKPNPLKPPAQGGVSAAFLLSEGAVMIDFAGPWEVFHDASFRTYTVAETPKPVRVMGGMQIVPDYTFETAPAPKVLVIPAQNGESQATLEWIRKVTKSTDVTMSVCTGAFLLAQTGLLSGKVATTHHSAYKSMALQFPDVHVKRGARFVEEGNLASSGGLSSGIDLALRVVERYYGRETATDIAYNLEYQGQGWMNPDSNEVYAKVPVSTDEHPLDPVCDMEVDPKSSPKSVYKDKAYYFCSEDHKKQFEAGPDKYLDFYKKP